MGFRKFFQRTRGGNTLQTTPVPAATVDPTGNVPLQPDQMAGLQDRPSKEAVRAILDAENLVRYNWFEDRYQHEYEAGIQKVDAGWRVYYADEKAGALFDREYADEADALTKFLDLARHNSKTLKRRWAKNHDR